MVVAITTVPGHAPTTRSVPPSVQSRSATCAVFQVAVYYRREFLDTAHLSLIRRRRVSLAALRGEAIYRYKMSSPLAVNKKKTSLATGGGMSLHPTDRPTDRPTTGAA